MKIIKVFSIVIRILLILAAILLTIDIFLTIGAAREYTQKFNHMQELEKECSLATGDKIIFCNANLSQYAYILTYERAALYPASSERLLFYIPFICAAIAWLFWYFPAQKFLLLKKNTWFWILAFLGLSVYGGLKVFWPTLDYMERLPGYILMLASDVLLVIASILGFTLISKGKEKEAFMIKLV